MEDEVFSHLASNSVRRISSTDVYKRQGYDRFGCPEGIYFKVSDRDGLFHAQQEFGCHTASVFGDYTAELKELAEVLGVEMVLAE